MNARMGGKKKKGGGGEGIELNWGGSSWEKGGGGTTI